ncbi:LysR family transcriptional regulator [Methylocystis bryophila]|uniref:LysR family transcriptional regulator n=1 Tax=Methylocystis bryophila TaxID=655015 RepID=A0A1W6MXE2_9HYPH|nr:LysR family transcriptional regulator [Methylocystis bryophila]ARN82233.1 LysR family transcriptional regulator [Methylocystis bryophila]BDV38372.1 transcriptional regulator [Methylocystis bryophila]
MNDRFASLQLFIRVARSGSFSAAARAMGMTQPTASRTIAALERQIGAKLLSRSTRAVTLTDAGLDYLARSEAILAALDEADHAARGTGELRGTLRVAMSPSFAIRTVFPRLARFSERHPDLRIEFALSDARHDLIGDSVDVAVRIGILNDSTALARKIGTVRRVLVASPAYLARTGTPRIPSDLAGHAIIVGPAGQGSEAWSFRKEGKTMSIRVQARLVIDLSEAATAAAVAGLGVVSTGAGSVQAEVEQGALVRLLPDWEIGDSDIHTILPAGRAAKASARAFAAFIAAEIREIEMFTI